MSTVEKFDRLAADQLKAEVPDAVIGREIIVLEQTNSTNDAILRVASTNGLPSIPEGLVVLAEHQTDGRGQRANRWESAAGKGLWFSILLRPEIQLSDSARLTVWAIEAISSVIRIEFGLEPAIKLPNDVQLNGHKVAGVLVEMRAQDKAPHLAVVGIGINVNQCRDDFPAELRDKAISLAMALGRQVDRQNFAVALLRNLDLTYRQKFSEAVAAFNSSPAPTTIRDKRVAKFRKA
jgi:BirA family transcriptional regulator, biotin operon repressor / biotin---[acetyl-CoA-carboxylase] ligase